MDKKNKAAGALKILGTSAGFFIIVALGTIIYGFFAYGRFWPAHIFNVNMLIGAFLILTGIIIFAFPARIKKGPLVDHSTIGQLRMEAREKKRITAYNLIYVGISNICITIIAQYILSLLWH